MITLRTQHSILPGFGLSLGCSMLFFCLILLLPLCALLFELKNLNWQDYWQIVSDSRSIAAYKVTLLSAFLACCFNAVFGLIMAWVLVRYTFPFRQLLDSLIDLPFALPTSVAGITLTSLFAPTGWYGNVLDKLDISVVNHWLGITIAMIFTSLPFVIRGLQPVLEELSKEYEEAAKILGASKRQTFFRILFPELVPALLASSALSFTRSLGEFGAVIFIAGNLPWKTEVVSLLIFVRLQEFDFSAACAIASVILLLSLVILCGVNLLQSVYARKLGTMS